MDRIKEITPLISIIVLSLNKIKFTRFCLKSFVLHSEYPEWELIVVDNGSTDGSVQWLDKKFREFVKQQNPRCRFMLIKNKRNVGCSTARNQGIEAAHGEYIVFCDNDIMVRTRRWLSGLAEVFIKFPNTGAVSPKLLYPVPPYNIQYAGAGVSPEGRITYLGRGEKNDLPQYNTHRTIQCAISACLMSKKNILSEVNGFDEAFNPIEYEDLDLCYRIKEKGFSIRYEPNVEMYHFENITSEGTPHIPNTYLIIKHGLLFKKRWKHVFEKEHGPDYSPWKRLKYTFPENTDELELK